MFGGRRSVCSRPKRIEAHPLEPASIRIVVSVTRLHAQNWSVFGNVLGFGADSSA